MLDQNKIIAFKMLTRHAASMRACLADPDGNTLSLMQH
jgi:hypothetical protein